MTSDIPVILALDCSTTACKAVVFDEYGRTVAESRRYLNTTSPRPGWYEQDADTWWDATADALTSVTELLGPDHRPVALGITHQRETFVCVDQRGKPIRPAILWLDGRARRQVEQLGSARLHAVTGKPPSTVPSLYKIAWLAEHEPDTLRRAHQVLDVHSYLTLRLTGRAVSSWAGADSTGLIDLRTKNWAEDIVLSCGATIGQLPLLVAPGHGVGPILPHIARRTGLPAGLPVVAGAGDGQCAGIGVGALTPGSAYLNLGTSFSLGTYVTGSPTFPGLRTMAGPQPDLHAVETLQLSGAATLTWFHDKLLGGPDPDLERQAMLVPPGAHGLMFLPYLSGRETPDWRPDERATLLGLGHRHGRPEIYRAILEGLAHDQSECLAHLEQHIGARIDHIIMTGGVVQSPLATQILAAVLPAVVTVALERECTALGAAIIVAASIPDSPYTSLLDAMRAMTRMGAPLHSNAETIEFYRSAGQRHRAFTAALSSVHVADQANRHGAG